ncbi:MAG: ABC transporter permease, partial [Cytophagaceae bacterium]|nr:ABC transporter permease [Gemmatimonadaceae bacterium]
MPELGRYARALRTLLWKPSVAAEVSSEVEAHLEMLEQDLVRQGRTPNDARDEARRRFGDMTRIAEECRAEGEGRDRSRRRTEWWDDLQQDVRQAWRQLRSSPRFAFVAIATLTVGLGAATTIFAIANAVMLRPLPFREPDRLALVLERNPAGMDWSISESNYLDMARRLTSFSSVAIFEGRRMALVADGEPEQLRGAVATHTFFPTLGVAPALGRAFLADEDRRGGDVKVAVLSNGLWQRRFGGAPDVLGRPITLDGVVHRIVGVMAPGFDFPDRTDVWVPLVPIPEYPRGDHRNEGIARLRAGVTLEQAAADVDRVTREMATEFTENAGWSGTVLPFKRWYVSPQLSARMVVLLATVGLLLAMACANVASLLLARAASRDREMAVRAALGAGRWRMMRQLMTESLVLSIAGAIGGVLAAAIAVPTIRNVGSQAIPRLAELAIDWRVMLFAIPACLLTGLVFGLAPALRLSHAARGGAGDRVHDLIRSGARVAESGRARQALVVASVALAMILLVSASLVGTSFRRLMRVDPGFRSDNVLVANFSLPDEQYPPEKAITFLEQVRARVQGIPGVAAVGASNIIPLQGGNTAMDFAAGEHESADKAAYRTGSWRAVTPGYFESLSIPLKRGRVFSSDDRFRPETSGRSDRVIIINEVMAEQLWPGVDPVGNRVALGNGSSMTVIGVVGATRQLSLDSLPAPAMYFAHAQFPWKTMWLTVRSAGDPLLLADALRREIRALDAGLPVANVSSLAQVIDRQAAEPRLTMLVFAIFASAALVLVGVGLYGTVSYSVTQRTREIGVSLALGAPPQRVVRGVLGAGLRLGVMGVVIGAVLAAGVAGMLRSILYATDPMEVVTYVGVAQLLMVVTALASALPARRASRLDPVVAL